MALRNLRANAPKILDVSVIVRSKTKDFIIKARKAHRDKYNYSKVVYVQSDEKVIIGCLVHGDFEQTPSSHLYGRGCPDCGRIKLANSLRLSTEEFIRRSIKKHGSRYGYSKASYVGGRIKIIITCPRHGNFEQDAANHLNGHGCQQCGQEQITEALKGVYCPFETAKKIVRDLGIVGQDGYGRAYRGDKRLPSHPDDIYKSEWQGWSDFMGTCNKRGRVTMFRGDCCESLGESDVQSLMEFLSINFLKQIWYERYRADWFLLDYGIFVEYFGGSRGGRTEYNRKTRAKLAFCKREGIKLVAIYPEDLRPARLRQLLFPYARLNSKFAGRPAPIVPDEAQSMHYSVAA